MEISRHLQVLLARLFRQILAVVLRIGLVIDASRNAVLHAAAVVVLAAAVAGASVVIVLLGGVVEGIILERVAWVALLGHHGLALALAARTPSRTVGPAETHSIVATWAGLRKWNLLRKTSMIIDLALTRMTLLVRVSLRPAWMHDQDVVV